MKHFLFLFVSVCQSYQSVFDMYNVLLNFKKRICDLMSVRHAFPSKGGFILNMLFYSFMNMLEMLHNIVAGLVIDMSLQNCE